MTEILALESATDVVGCAVGRHNDNLIEVRASMLANSDRSHGQMLAPMVKAVLSEAEMSIADIDLVAVDCGPGRYTGLRVGIATAAALAYGQSLPVVKVSSTELLAFGARSFNGYIVSLVDARRGEVFYAVYRGQGHQGPSAKHNSANHNSAKHQGTAPGCWLEEIMPARVGKPDDVITELSKYKGRKLLLGDSEIVGSVINNGVINNGAINNGVINCGVVSPSPSSLVVLAAQKAEAGQVWEASELAPLYLRPPDINTARKDAIKKDIAKKDAIIKDTVR